MRHGTARGLAAAAAVPISLCSLCCRGAGVGGAARGSRQRAALLGARRLCGLGWASGCCCCGAAGALWALQWKWPGPARPRPAMPAAGVALAAFGCLGCLGVPVWPQPGRCWPPAPSTPPPRHLISRSLTNAEIVKIFCIQFIYCLVLFFSVLSSQLLVLSYCFQSSSKV